MSDVCLVIVGNMIDVYKPLLEVNLAFKKSVYFIGRVEDTDLRTIYSNANSFYFMSTYEGFGLPPLEAMACGIPVVVAKSTSLPEVVGDAGLLLEPNDEDALCEAMLNNYNHVKRANWIEKGLARAQNFNWEKCADNYIDIIIILIYLKV